MVLQMLEAGGVDVLSDGERQSDDDNPRGYYELEAVKQTRDDPSWLEGAAGKAVKLISQLLYDLPEGIPCKVIFLRRQMGEILVSQRRMLERRGEASGYEADDGEMARIFESHLRDVLHWVRERDGLELMEVWYGDVLRETERVAGEMAVFLERELDVAAMANVVDGGLHRNRVGEVTES